MSGAPDRNHHNIPSSGGFWHTVNTAPPLGTNPAPILVSAPPGGAWWLVWGSAPAAPSYAGGGVWQQNRAPNAFGGHDPSAFGASGFAYGAPSAFGAAPVPPIFAAAASFGNPAPFGAPYSTGLSFGNPTPFGASTTGSFGAPVPVGFGASAGHFGAPVPGAAASGTRVAPYQVTTGQDCSSNIVLQSITAMKHYNDLSHEELRFADYSQGNRGTAASALSMGLHGSTPAPTNTFGYAAGPVAGVFASHPTAAFGSAPASTTGVFGAPAPAPVGIGAPTKLGGAPAPGAVALGTHVTPYQVTTHQDGSSKIVLQSITAMKQYNDQSHEELRFADYSQGNRGTSAPAPSTDGVGLAAAAPVRGGLVDSTPTPAPTAPSAFVAQALTSFGTHAPSSVAAPSPLAAVLRSNQNPKGHMAKRCKSL